MDKLSNNPDHDRSASSGFQWSWQFNYPRRQRPIAGHRHARPAARRSYLPGRRDGPVHRVSPDVIHSFWVPAFLFKRDVIPGQVNTLRGHADQAGTFAGRCAELCGDDHARMLFNVEGRRPADYELARHHEVAASDRRSHARRTRPSDHRQRPEEPP